MYPSEKLHLCGWEASLAVAKLSADQNMPKILQLNNRMYLLWLQSDSDDHYQMAITSHLSNTLCRAGSGGGGGGGGGG